MPLVLLVPSTLSTGIGLGSLLQGIRCLITNFESMNCPSAPESIRADVGMCFSCACREMGNHNADSDSSALST